MSPIRPPITEGMMDVMSEGLSSRNMNMNILSPLSSSSSSSLSLQVSNTPLNTPALQSKFMETRKKRRSVSVDRRYALVVQTIEDEKLYYSQLFKIQQVLFPPLPSLSFYIIIIIIFIIIILINNIIKLLRVNNKNI